MDAHNNLVKLMSVEVDGHWPFEQLITKTIPSVISLAIGPEESKKPNRFFGTAFGVSLYHKNDQTDVFLTCSHVFDNLMAELAESRDKTKFVSIFHKDGFEWIEIESIRRFSPNLISGNPDEDFAETHDISLCRIPGIHVPPLTLSDNKYIYGAEVGILGFPNYEHFQKIHPQPSILKTVISGELIYPLETLNGQAKADRLALGCVTGHGFSGSPVFSAENGRIVGMHDYAPIENDIWMKRERTPRCMDSDLYVEYPGGISFAIPSTRLRQAINLLETHCYLDQVRRFLR
jgi:hypothetical protein